MIDRDARLPVKRQAKLLGISRGSVYYLPRAGQRGGPDADAADRRAAPGAPVRGRAHAARSARQRRLRGRPQARGHADAQDGHRGAVPQAQHEQARIRRIPMYPYLLRGLAIERANQVWAHGHHVHPDGARLRVPGRRHRLVQPQGAGLARVEHDGRPTSASRRCRTRSPATACPRSSTPTRAASSPLASSPSC